MAGTVPYPDAVVLTRPVPGYDFPKGHIIEDAATIAEIYEKELHRNVVAVDPKYAAAHAVATPKTGA